MHTYSSIDLVLSNTFSSDTIIIEYIKCIFLGFIQGITEFLPISSTAHLKALPMILGWGDPGTSFIASLQLGSVAAVIIYFWKDIIYIFNGFKNIPNIRYSSERNDSKLAIFISLTSLPIIITGFFIKMLWSGYNDSIIRGITSISFVSIVMAIFLYFAEQVGTRNHSINQLSLKKALFIGLAQSLAIIPGTSRSGVTLASGMLFGLKREAAARYSFLAGIPAITLAGLVELPKMLFYQEEVSILGTIFGICSAFLFSLISIDLLLKFLKRYTTLIFIQYRIMFGITLLIWQFLHY